MRGAGFERVSASSLVGGSKSSTPENWAFLGGVYAEEHAAELLRQQEQREDEYHRSNAAWFEAVDNERIEYADTLPNKQAGRFVRLSAEPWRAIAKDRDSGRPYTPLEPEKAAWKATLYTDTQNKPQPPRQAGDRWTDKLTSRAQQAIENSAKYCWRMGFGYRVFTTLTFDDAARADIALHDRRGAFECGRPHNNYHGPFIPDEHRLTIGRRVTAFLNTLQQRYRNGKVFAAHYRRDGKQKIGGGYQANGERYTGRIEAPGKATRWTPIKWQKQFRLTPHGRGFAFTWVIENPTNERGESNPHVHLMISWQVKKFQFHAWAAWIERTWGKGFCKLERLRNPASAANYMAKAANYMAKGGDGSQGEVRGNRYSIAKDAHAPKARSLGTYFAGWLRDAVNVLQDAPREKLPAGLWSHKWGFGANTRAAWGQIWQTLKADGWRWRDKPPSSLAARVEQSWPRMMQIASEWFVQPAEYLNAVMNEPEPEWIN